ncbi:hypothetical protein ACVW0W_005495 [Bradyrhizobium sp. USDA 4469]
MSLKPSRISEPSGGAAGLRLLRRHRNIDRPEADLDLPREDRGDTVGVGDARQEDADPVGALRGDADRLYAGVLETLLDHGDGVFDEVVQPRGGCRIGRREPDCSVAAIGHGYQARWQPLCGGGELARKLLAIFGVGDLQLDAAIADRKVGEGDMPGMQGAVNVVAQIRDDALAQAVAVHAVDDARPAQLFHLVADEGDDLGAHLVELAVLCERCTRQGDRRCHGEREGQPRGAVPQGRSHGHLKSCGRTLADELNSSSLVPGSGREVQSLSGEVYRRSRQAMDERQIIHHCGPARPVNRSRPRRTKCHREAARDDSWGEDGIPWRASTRSIGSSATNIRSS